MAKHSSKNDATKTRTFDIVLYDDPRNVLPHLANIRHFAFILHNHDINDDTGEIKKEHFHLILVFNNPRSLSGLYRELTFYCEQNVFIEPVKNSIGCSFLYLIHQSKKAQQDGKIPYKLDDVICDDIVFWNEKARQCSEETENTYSNEKFIYDLFYKNSLELSLLYGRDYIKNMRAYNEFGNHLRASYSNIENFINNILDKQL